MALSKGPLAKAEKIQTPTPRLQESNRIAAIDFGTSSVSIAYTRPTDGQIRLVPLHKTSERVPNAILIVKDQGKDQDRGQKQEDHDQDQKVKQEQDQELDQNQKKEDKDQENQQCKVIGIGHRAQSMYSDLKSDAENFIYFERIKSILKRDKSVNRTTEVSSFTGGGSYYLIEVIAFILTHLKKLLTDHLKGNNKSSDFDWVITVPAIWKARARRMMREAAYMAGLTSDAPGITRFTPVGSPLPRQEEVNPEKLSLALEPEVAAIYAQHQSEVSGTPPLRYMVVDIGGGTVDITVHDKSNGRISVVLPPMGNNWGGTTVNEAFSEKLQEAVDDEDFESFTKQYSICGKSTLNKVFYEEFEERKKIFGDAIEGINKITVTLPKRFTMHYGGNVLTEVKKLKMHYDAGESSLNIGYDQLEEKVFKLTIEKILECVKTAFDELTDHIDTVYLVGGFGGCTFVSQKIDEAIRPHRGMLYDNIVCPVHPDLAVVTGAVMWRKDPNIIQSRVADATYGTVVDAVFNRSIHDVCYWFVNEDHEQLCADVFDVFVLKGEVLRGDEVYKGTLVPAYQRQTQMHIPIYCTADDGVQYVRDKKGKPTVHKIGELLLDIPNPKNVPKKDRKFDVFMDFSGTEIQARAQYSITGEEVKTVCDFLSKQD